jgi:hypothetical protein
MKYSTILDQCTKTLNVAKKEIIQQEFWTYVMLEFSLFVSMEELLPHLKRIVEKLGSEVFSNDFFIGGT